MEKTPQELTARGILPESQCIARIIRIIAQFNYDMGLKIGYHKGKRDEREGKPLDQEIERLP